MKKKKKNVTPQNNNNNNNNNNTHTHTHTHTHTQKKTTTTTTTTTTQQQLQSQHTGPGIILESAPRNTIFCLFTETKWQTFRGIIGFYSTSGAVDYTAAIFCVHLVAVKYEVFTATSTREIQLCARPATQLTCFPLLPAISHASPLRMRENLSERGLFLAFSTRACSG